MVGKWKIETEKLVHYKSLVAAGRPRVCVEHRSKEVVHSRKQMRSIVFTPRHIYRLPRQWCPFWEASSKPYACHPLLVFQVVRGVNTFKLRPRLTTTLCVRLASKFHFRFRLDSLWLERMIPYPAGGTLSCIWTRTCSTRVHWQ